MIIYLFENNSEALNLEPLSHTRPLFDLRCGAFTVLERVCLEFPDARIGLFVREELADVVRERHPEMEVNPGHVETALWLNGRALWRKSVVDTMLTFQNTMFFAQKDFVGAVLYGDAGEKWLNRGGPLTAQPPASLEREAILVECPVYLWDYVHANGEAITEDSELFDLGGCEGTVGSGVHRLNETQLYVGSGSRVKAGAVLDAEDGPVIIGKRVTVLPGAYLQGPLLIGDGSLIKAGARIYGGTTIGPGCKIGGEVTESIFQSWSNKQHDGFIGHAFIGEWVNLGADTNNSDLKNNYTNVKVSVNGEVIDSGSLFVGLFMGDHSKTGINTMFNTGTAVGPGSNIVGYGFPPRTIAPFSWMVNGRRRSHLIEKFMAAARTAKKRRNQHISPAEEQFYKWLFENSGLKSS